MIINGERIDLTNGITISEMLKILELNSEKVVVEVDLEIVNKDEFSVKKLSSESKIEIISFVGGG
jgi:sulfur carrier protein